MMLAVPLILSFVTGLAFSQDEYSVPVAFVDNDGSEIAQDMIRALSVPPYRITIVAEEEARDLVGDREVSAAIIIPPGLERSLREGEPEEIAVLRADFQESPRMVEQHLTGLLVQIQSAAAAASLAEARGVSWTEAYRAARDLWEPDPPVTVEVTALDGTIHSEIPIGYNLSSPGYVVMFGMMTVIVAGASTILSERDGGTLGRLLAAPLSRSQLMTGKTLGIILGGIVQMFLLILLDQILFGVNWGSNLPALMLLVISLGIASGGIGIFLASLCRTSSQASATGVLVVLTMSMLGGTWWPLEVIPSHM